MLIRHFVVAMLSVGLMGAGVVSGQPYPNKFIRIITGGASGGDSDTMARQIGQGISGPLGQPVTIDTRPLIAAIETASKAPPDGYTLLLVSSAFWTGPLLQKMPYDPVSDFSPITSVAKGINVVVVHPMLPVKSIKELIALAKARPGELNYGTSSVGTSSHLAAELFEYLAGVNIVRVSYRDSALRMTGLLSNEVQIEFSSPLIMTHVKEGKLRALAITGAEPSALVPGLPTVAASLPGYEAVSMNVMLAPAKTPQAIINRLNQEAVRVLNTAETKERFLSIGVEPVGSSPDELAATIKSETAMMGKMIKAAGIKVE